VKTVKNGGTLYISLHIGAETRVHFNAHRDFHSRETFTWLGHEMLQPKRFDYVDDQGSPHKDYPLMETLPLPTFECGIHTFRKHSLTMPQFKGRAGSRLD
jgi:hypothetical protein